MAHILDGSVAFVTGGGAGIGRAIALALAEAGADIVLAEIDPVRGHEAAARVREAGRRALFVPTDAADPGQLRAAVAQADAEFGRLDILVNNVGGVSRRNFLDQSERSRGRHVDLNLGSLFAATAAAVPLIARGQRGGAILNVSSIEVSRAAPGFAVYAACKAGMESFTRTMALELAGDAIRVNAIAPDYTDTPGTRGIGPGFVDGTGAAPLPEAMIAATARRIPLGRVGIAAECGAAALFLCTPAASYVTGVVLPVDGGCAASLGWMRASDGSWSLTPR